MVIWHQPAWSFSPTLSGTMMLWFCCSWNENTSYISLTMLDCMVIWVILLFFTSISLFVYSGAFREHPRWYDSWSTESCPWYSTEYHHKTDWLEELSYCFLIRLNFLNADDRNHPVLIHCKRGKVVTVFPSMLPSHESNFTTLLTRNFSLYPASDRLSCGMPEKSAEVVPHFCVWWVPKVCSCKSKNFRPEVHGVVWYLWLEASSHVILMLKEVKNDYTERLFVCPLTNADGRSCAGIKWKRQDSWNPS